MEAHIRVHTEYITQEVLHEYLKHYCDMYYIALETDAERPHFQGYVKFKSNYASLESLRNQLKKRLSQKGNKVYSISMARESRSRHIAYLKKEGNDPVLQYGVPVGDIRTANELVETFKVRSKMSPLEKLADGYSGGVDVKQIGTYIIREFKIQGKMIPDVRMMKRYIENIRIIKWPEVYRDNYLQEVERLFQVW